MGADRNILAPAQKLSLIRGPLKMGADRNALAKYDGYYRIRGPLKMGADRNWWSRKPRA